MEMVEPGRVYQDEQPCRTIGSMTAMNREAMHHADLPSGGSDAARIGVVLSSGGGRGIYAHTGFLLALERMGIDIRASAGCSAGAVVGGVAASGTDLQRWAHTIAQVARHEFWTPDS